MKKIVCVHLWNDFSGSPRILAGVVKALQKNGRQVDLFVGGRSKDGGLLDFFKDQTSYFFYRRHNIKILTLLHYILSQAFLFLILIWKYKKEKPIFYVNTMLPFGGALAAKVIGAKVIYHIHEHNIKPDILKNFLRLIIKKSSNYNIFPSKWLLSTEKVYGVPSVMIRNFLPKKFVELGERSGSSSLHDGIFRVSMICSLRSYKGIDEFFHLASKFSTQKQIVFLLVVNASQDEVNTFLRDLSIPKNMTVVHSIDNVEEIYRQSSLLLNLSHPKFWIESFGMTIIEAMAFGVPVIGPTVGGPKEIISHGINGYCLDCYETEALEKAVLNLFSSPDLWARFSKEAFLTSQYYSEDEFFENIGVVVNKMESE